MSSDNVSILQRHKEYVPLEVRGFSGEVLSYSLHLLLQGLNTLRKKATQSQLIPLFKTESSFSIQDRIVE